MPIVDPPDPPSTPPAVPTSSDTEASFDAALEAWHAWQRDALYPYAVAAAAGVAANANEASAAAALAASSAASATAARDTALAAANFKGNWSDLTGALSMPACVRHNGRFWVLLANAANVATVQPGVSAGWAALDAGTVPSQLLSTAGATVNAVVGVRYLVGANNVTLVVPTGLIKGDFHGARWMTGATGGVWNFGTTPLRGWAAGTLEIDVTRFGLDLFYEDATRGLI